MKNFLIYFAWAAVQHSIAILPFWFSNIDELNKLIYSTLVFSFVFHVGNTLLTILTFVLAISFYPLIFLTEYYHIIIVILLTTHSLAGNFLKSKNIKMQVWRF